MSDTPETDKQWADWLNKLKMPIESFVEFARKLERERDQARLEAKLLRVENNHNWQANDLAEQAFRERDEARAALQRITESDMRWSKKIARDALEGIK